MDYYNQILKGDCIKLIKKLGDQSYDHLITDIPYNICSNYEDIVKERQKTGSFMKKLHTAKFINKDADIFDVDLKELSNEIDRVIKKSITIWCSPFQFADLRRYFEELGWKGGRMLIWHKTNAQPHNYKYCFIQDTEIALYMFKDSSSFNSEQKVKGTVYTLPIYVDKEKMHPTQKHPDLVKRLINDITKKGDSILDITTGSGQIVIDAIKMGRLATGFEIKDKYYNIAKDRLDNLMMNKVMMLVANS